MGTTVFFSWQSDRSSKDCRNFIDDALKKALKRISNDLVVDEPIRVDKDTEGVSGTPPIFETIRQKIESAAAVVIDVTFVAKRLNYEQTPNPNVLIEYGYALKAIGYRRVVLVMNTAFGAPGRDMPFDMALNRYPIRYCISEDADETLRKTEKQSLVKNLETAIKAIFESEEYKASLPKPVEIPVKYREPLQGHSLFHPKDQPLGYVRSSLGSMLSQRDTETHMSEAPAIWFRIAPKYPIATKLKMEDLEKRVMRFVTLPLFGSASGISMVRRADGWGCGIMFDKPKMSVVCQVFTDGEVWAIDQFTLNETFDGMQDVISMPGFEISQSVETCEEFLSQLSVSYPLRFVIGIEGIRGRQLLVSSGGSTRRRGACAEDRIEIERFINSPQDRIKALEDFIDELYQQCGVTRPKK